MKITKKILTVVLALMMLSSMMISAYAAAFSDVDANHSSYTAISTLADMGIINGYTDGTFKPDNAVTRAEMAKLISMLYGYDVNSVAVSPFSDVENDHWAVTYIATMKAVGIINGMGDGTFLPNNQVTYEQAIKMIVCALNWGEVAAQTSTATDWSLGYRNMALRLGITKNVVVAGNSEPASRSTIAQLLYNSLDAKPAERVVDSSGNVSYKESQNTVGAEKQSMFELNNALIECTPTINTNPNTMLIKADFVRFRDLSGKTYDMSVGVKKDILNYVGRYVNIQYQVDSNDNMTLMSYSLIGESQKVEIRKLKSVSASSIEYYSDDAFEKTSKISIENPIVMYNNRILSNAGDFVALLEKDAGLVSDANDTPLNYFGSVEVFDAPAGDLVVVNSYKSYYMSTAVNTKEFKITLEGLANPVAIPVKDLINYEIKKKTKLEDIGTTPTSLSISSNSIVTLSMSPANCIGTSYIEFLTNSSKKTGTPTEVTITPNRSDKATIVIGTDTYKVSNVEAANVFAVGSSTQFLTDASGMIVKVTNVVSGNKRFGYYAAYVSGDVNEDDSVKIKFYDPEAKEYFTVTISDAKGGGDPSNSDVSFINQNKNSGKLFWMNITTNGKVKKGDIKFAENITEADEKDTTVVYDKGTDIYKSGSQYTLTGSTNKNYSSTYGAVFVRPDSMSTKNEFTYSNFNMVASSSTKYNNPEVYQIKRADRTYVFVMIDKFKGLQQSSNVYVVNEIGNSSKVGDNNVTKVSYYNFKTGAASTEGKELVFLTSVLESLNLKKGDVFTYYDDSEIDGVNFDKLTNISILLRAEDLSADKTKAKDLENILVSEKNASVYQNGFRKFGIYQSSITSPYTNFTLQVPVYTDTNEENGVMLYLGRSNVQSGSAAITKLEQIETFVPGETKIADEIAEMFPADADPLTWNASNVIDALGDHVTGVKATTSTKLFVYDLSADEKERLTVYQKPTIDELKTELGNMINVEMLEHADAATVAANLEKCALTYAYFTNYSATLTTLFIIK